MLTTGRAAAEIKIGEADGWEVYTSGQVGAFLSYAFGDAYPVPPVSSPDRNIVGGGGIGFAEKYKIPEVDAAGNNVPGAQGTVSQFRVRNGFSPNVLGFGLRKQVTPDLKLKAQFSIWGTIEPPGLHKYNIVEADFREGWGQVEGNWGAVTVGRHLGLYSRGIVEMDFLYAHQYGMGFPGSFIKNGPTAGLIGFGVLAAFFSPGIMYTSPKFGGVQLNVGVYDSVQIPGSWEVTRTPRPEFEFTWDHKSNDFFAKVFVNGAYQKLYRLVNATEEETMYGAGFGGRLEFGPYHFGAGGHVGRGLGLFYALEGGDTSVGPLVPKPGEQSGELRTFEGIAAFAQYAPGKFDINLGFGQSRVRLLETDKTGPEPQTSNNSVIKTQTAISAGFVYHITDKLHWDIDYLRAMFRWYRGDKQDVNFINTGITLQW